MRHICLYIGVQIFIAYGRAGPPEVVQEALADLKIVSGSRGMQKVTKLSGRWFETLIIEYFFI